ncbi:MAG: pyridoxine 5'-phosphate oxidase C-terminal domain-containing protein, partial [Phycisphaerales bacterium]
RATDAESDAYFASRRLESRIGAWVSEQSQPIESRQALLEKVAGVMEKLEISPADLMEGRDIEIPRPPYWGGYRIHAQGVELWSAGVGRIHDRARWTREVSRPADPPQDRGPHACTYGPWSATRLQP